MTTNDVSCEKYIELMQIDIEIEDHRWEETGLTSIAKRAALAVLGHLNIDTEKCELSVLGCSDNRIRTLNADFREKDMATNVLSWPADERGANIDGEMPEKPEVDAFNIIELGDIAISYDTCWRESLDADRSISDHTMHLMVHAILHLLGFDHIRDKDATLMENIETGILGKMGISDPYT